MKNIENDFPEVFDKNKLEKYKGMSREDVAHVLYANISRLESCEVSRQFTGGTEITCKVFIPDPPVVDIYEEVDEYLRKHKKGKIIFSATDLERPSLFAHDIVLTYTDGPFIIQGTVPDSLNRYTI